MCNPLLIIGHRGAMGYETENTLASVKKAMDIAVDMIEIDVFKIKTGEIVVFHDDTLERLTNGKGKIEAYNFTRLRQLTLIGNHKIPLLVEVLELIDNKVGINIELKGANTAEDVNTIINHFIKEKGWNLENFLISSFNWDELLKMREINKAIAIAVLTEEDPIEAIPTAVRLKAKAINPNFKKLTLENVNTIREAGFKIYTWTVNTPSELKQVKEISVDGIFTNYPETIN